MIEDNAAVNWSEAPATDVRAATARHLVAPDHPRFRVLLALEAARETLRLPQPADWPAVAEFRCHAELTELLAVRLLDELTGRTVAPARRFLGDLAAVADRGGCQRDMRVALRRTARWWRLVSRERGLPCPSGSAAFLRSEWRVPFLAEAVTQLTFETREYLPDPDTEPEADQALACFRALNDLINVMAAVLAAHAGPREVDEDRWEPSSAMADHAEVWAERHECPGVWIGPFARALEAADSTA